MLQQAMRQVTIVMTVRKTTMIILIAAMCLSFPEMMLIYVILAATALQVDAGSTQLLSSPLIF